jgi:hypothetical protein
MIKKLSTYLLSIFISFSVPTYADNISEYEIGGISIGDSLLNHLSKNEILTEIEANKSVYNHLNSDFGEVYLFKKIGKYEQLSFFVKQNDRYYTIYSITGAIEYDEKFEACLTKQKKIEKEFSKIYVNTKKIKLTHKFDWDPTGESISQNIVFDFKSGDNIQVNCTKYKKSLKIENGWADGFMISINKKEVTDWFENPIN